MAPQNWLLARRNELAQALLRNPNPARDLNAGLGNVLFEIVQTFAYDVEASEGMAHVLRVVGGIAPSALLQRARPALRRMRTKAFESAGGRNNGAWQVGNLHQPHIHLKEVKPSSKRSLRRLPVTVPLGCSTSVSQ
jgi:hypothetical protein